MSDTMLLAIAISVFSLLLVGLALTIYEFKAHVVEHENKKKTSNKK